MNLPKSELHLTLPSPAYFLSSKYLNGHLSDRKWDSEIYSSSDLMKKESIIPRNILNSFDVRSFKKKKKIKTECEKEDFNNELKKIMEKYYNAKKNKKNYHISDAEQERIGKLTFDQTNGLDNSNHLDSDEFPSRTPKIKGFSTSRNSKRNPYFTPKKMRLKEIDNRSPLALSERTYLKFSKFEENDNKEEKFYTSFTEENLRKFERNVDVLNKTDTSREKSAEFLNHKNSRKERVDRYIKLEQDSNELELHEISLKNQKKNNMYLIKQLEFKYFFIKIKDKPSPLSIALQRVEKNKLGNIKVFLSTKSKQPNTFNCEQYHQSFCFSFSEKIKQLKNFQDEKLYVSVFSEEPLKILIKAKFYDPDNVQKYENNKKRPNVSAFEKIENTTLHKKIAEILQKRKQKILDLAHGENKVILNKNVSRLSPSEKHRLIDEKKKTSKKTIEQVLEKKKLMDEEEYDFKNKLLSKHDLLKIVNNEISRQIMQKGKINFIKKAWMKLIVTLTLCFEINKQKTDVIKKRAKEAYFKQMRKKAITKLVSFTRMVGRNPGERLITDSCIILNLNYSKKNKLLKIKAGAILKNFLSHVGLRYYLDYKIFDMEERIINIQRKWRDLTKRKIFFSMLIRNLWKEKFNQIFMSFRVERSREPLSPKRRTNLFEVYDSEIQNKIINKFLERNLMNWRKEMEEYRSNMQKIKNDHENKSKFMILQKLMRKSITAPLKIMDSLNMWKDQASNNTFFEPPLLYKKPDDNELKDMIYQYLIEKNLI